MKINVSNLKQINKTVNKKKIMIYIAMLFLIIYVCYTIYLLIRQPTSIFTIEEGKLYKEETAIGYVIRDEKIIKGNNYKNGMEQIKFEGEKVSKNENVFRYYSKNEESLKQKIAELDEKIQEIMKNDTNLFSSDMKLLENQIDDKVANINKIKDVTKLEEYKREIDALVKKKSKIAGDLSPKGSYLNQLIEERKNCESQLNSGAEYVTAPMSGIVSYKVDELEEVLTINNFSNLSLKYFEDLNLKTGKVVATSDECGKIIDNFSCYIAAVANSENAKNANIGDKIKIRLSNNAEIPATITNIIKEENEENILVVLKINKQIEELINYRKISLDLIWWSESGLKVPNQAIIQEDTKNYVIRNRAGYLDKILIKVKKQGEKYSIIEAYETEEMKKEGFSNEEIAKYRKISLYDEILFNPKANKIY